MVFSAATMLASEAAAKVPLALTEQGRIFDNSGEPVKGSVAITFTFYDADTDGAALWTETHITTLEDGYFSVALGSVTALEPAELFDGSARYLGITVNGDEEMSPRQAVGSV